MKCLAQVLPSDQDEDRVGFESRDGLVFAVLADGAGGISGGRQAAEALIARVCRSIAGPDDAVAELLRLDQVLDADPDCGETTAVLVVVDQDKVFGASVGDSGAWLLTDSGVIDLTHAQRRKPLVGSGLARPVGFGPLPLHGRLLMASDGLLKYLSPHRICTLALLPDLDQAVQQLTLAVRLPSGDLHDDVSLILLDPALD